MVSSSDLSFSYDCAVALPTVLPLLIVAPPANRTWFTRAQRLARLAEAKSVSRRIGRCTTARKDAGRRHERAMRYSLLRRTKSYSRARLHWRL